MSCLRWIYVLMLGNFLSAKGQSLQELGSTDEKPANELHPPTETEAQEVSDYLEPNTTCPAGRKFDMCLELANLSQIQKKWSDDPAFLPTVITYAIAFFLGIIGNVLVIFALLGDRKSHNVTSSFLVSLAVADLLFLILCVPHEVGIKLKKEWAGGAALCKMFGYIEMLSGVATVLNLTAVTVERYVVIVHPMKSRTWCTMGNTKKIIAGVWVIAVLLSLPTLHIMDTYTSYYYNSHNSVTLSLCMQSGGTLEERRIIRWYQLLVMFLVPVKVMLFCYSFVIHVLWISTKELAKLTHSNSMEEESKQRLTHSPNRHTNNKTILTRAVKNHSVEVREARKQVIKMLLTIIGIFFICWGPRLIFNVLKTYELKAFHREPAFYTQLIFYLLPYLQSCTNPIIYCFMSNNFRKSMRNACRTRCHVCTRFAQAVTNSRHCDFDMETKSMNSTSKYSPTSVTNARNGRTMYTSIVSEC